MRSRLPTFLVAALFLGGCGKGAPDAPASGAPPLGSASSPASSPVAVPVLLIEREAEHVGGVIARAPGSEGLFIADEDHGLLRFIADPSPLAREEPPRPAASASAAPGAGAPLASASASAAAPPASAAAPPASAAAPLASASAAPSAPASVDAALVSSSASSAPRYPDHAAAVAQETLALGGAPANLLALRDGALVTVRDPGKLVRVRRGADGKLAIVHELPIAADAWGLAVDLSGTRALITSAWTGMVTLVSIGDDGLHKCAELPVGREPRAVVFASDELAYVNHLVGNALTRIKIGRACEAGALGEAVSVVVPPAPTRSPAGRILPASLGYALALSPDGKRLFVPRHALGARSHSSWFGASTVDVLRLPDESPLAPLHAANLPGLPSPTLKMRESAELSNEPTESWSAFVQPRDLRYRSGARTLLVVSEGADRLVELDATAMDPSMAIAEVHELSDAFRRHLREPRPDGLWPSGKRRAAYVDPSGANPSGNRSCAAPQGVVLDLRGQAALIFCRASTTLARVQLHESITSDERVDADGLSFAPLGDDAGGKDLSLGKRLFYGSALAEGMGCAGCHPEGRDDGHVWREVTLRDRDTKPKRFLGGPEIHGGPTPAALGVPRRTPMLVDRVLAKGPYGWLGESESLEQRITAGTQLHAGDGPPSPPAYYINAVGVFIRTGFGKPPALGRELSAEEQRGKALFSDRQTKCDTCHEPTRWFSNQTTTRLPALPTLPGFEAEPDAAYKTPSLVHVGQHAPLFHDGSAKSLEELIERNGTRMGDTAHLSPADRKALVAYLRTL